MTSPFGGTSYDVVVRFATISGVPNALVSASGLRFVALEQQADSPAQRLRPLTDVNNAPLAGDVIVANAQSGLPRFNVPGDNRASVWVQTINATDDPVGSPFEVYAADLPAQVRSLRSAVQQAAASIPATALGQPNGPAVLGSDGRLTYSQLPTNIGSSGTTSPATVEPATTTTRGVVRLAGALGGTADAPTVPGLASKVESTDARLSDARNPKAGSVTAASIATGGLPTSAIAGTAVTTGDARLSDARAPLTHGHTAAQITDFAQAVLGTTGIVKTVNGAAPDAAGNVDASGGGSLTADQSARIAGSVQRTTDGTDFTQPAAVVRNLGVTDALAKKADLTSPTFTGTPTLPAATKGLTKATVGLTVVDNTADADKPVSTKQAAAIAAAKAPVFDDKAAVQLAVANGTLGPNAGLVLVRRKVT